LTCAWNRKYIVIWYPWKYETILANNSFESPNRLVRSYLVAGGLTNDSGMPVHTIRGMAGCMNSNDKKRSDLAKLLHCYIVSFVVEESKLVSNTGLSLAEMFALHCEHAGRFAPGKTFDHSEHGGIMSSTLVLLFRKMWKQRKNYFQRAVRTVAMEYGLISRMSNFVPSDVPAPTEKEKAAFFYFYAKVKGIKGPPKIASFVEHVSKRNWNVRAAKNKWVSLKDLFCKLVGKRGTTIEIPRGWLYVH